MRTMNMAGVATFIASCAERWGRLTAFAATNPAVTRVSKFLTPRFWRTMEWMLALAWPFVAYHAVFKRYGWKSDYYNRWDESWFALVLLVPMVGPVLVKLFSANGMEARKRFGLAAVMALGVALAMKFRPDFGGVSFRGFFVPMGLHALVVFLWFCWRNKQPLPPKQEP